MNLNATSPIFTCFGVIERNHGVLCAVDTCNDVWPTNEQSKRAPSSMVCR